MGISTQQQENLRRYEEGELTYPQAIALGLKGLVQKKIPKTHQKAMLGKASKTKKKPNGVESFEDICGDCGVGKRRVTKRSNGKVTIGPCSNGCSNY